MKQKSPPPPTQTTTRSVPPPPPPSLCLRASSKARESPPQVVNMVTTISSTTTKSVPPDLKNISKAKRGIVLNKIEEGSQKGSSSEAEEGKVIVVAAARPRRRVRDFGLKRSEDNFDGNKKKGLLEKLEVRENLIKNLQAEVLELKAELDKVNSLNVELQSQNIKLTFFNFTDGHVSLRI